MNSIDAPITDKLQTFSIFYNNYIPRDRKEHLDKTFPEADAFQQLCFDLLSRDPQFKSRFPLIRLIPFKTKGADGAIDGSGYYSDTQTGQTSTLIIECKKNESREYAERAWKELQKKLKENISKNANYAPWRDPNLYHYVYCTSCSMENQAERDAFILPICQFFRELAKESNLPHLNTLASNIHLYTWHDLILLLEKDRFLYHKWVQEQYIDGIEPLRHNLESNRGTRYRDYLTQEKQPYFSRDDYVKQNPQAKGLVTESHILHELLENDSIDGYIIYGEGGIGKTRLMREIGFMAQEWGWIVLLITLKINLDTNALKRLFYPNNHYLLLFDYIEESPAYDDPQFFNTIIQGAPGAKIKILGNCRKTHIDSSRLNGADGFITCDISIKDKQIESNYKSSVVEHILGDLKRLFKVQESFYRLRPAFAVFLRYMNDKHPIAQKELDFRGENAFREWMNKQLLHTFDKPNLTEFYKQPELSRIFFILSSSFPIPIEPFKQVYPDVIPLLQKDGWVDIEEIQGKEQIKVIHDTISEEILILRLRSIGKEGLKEEIANIFNFAISFNGLENGFRLVERVSDWIHGLDKIEPGQIKSQSPLFSRIFSKEIIERPDSWHALKKALINTPLMDEKEIIDLMTRNNPFFFEVMNSIPFGLYIALKLRYVIKNKGNYDPQTQSELKEVLRRLLDNWLNAFPNFDEYRYLSSRVIASIIDFSGASGQWEPQIGLQEKVLQWLNKYRKTKDAQFVICSWLDAGGQKEIMSPYLLKWLEHFQLEFETRFVICSWLDAGGEKEIISPYLSQWLECFPLEFETGFAICSWLNAGGQHEIVSPFLSQWLQCFPLEMETSFVLKSWLNAGGEKEIVSSYVVDWLKHFSNTIETHFVIKSWLDAGGEKEIVSPYLSKWLEQFPLEMETSFVLKSWLDAKGSKEIVSSYLSQWLQCFPLEMETRFVICSWLDAGGQHEIVSPYFSKWLEHFPIEMETSFVICSWLNAGGEKEIVSSYLTQWLQQFSMEKDTSFVLRSWLDAKGSKEIVSSYVIDWLKQFPTSIETRFVIKSWLDAGGEKEIVSSYLSQWLQCFSLEMETGFVICSWLDAGGEKEIVSPYLSQWLQHFPIEKETGFVICSWLDAGGEKEIVSSYLSQWLQNFPKEKETGFVICSWLDAGGEWNTVSPYIPGWLKNFPLEKEAGFIIKSWLLAGGDKKIIQPYLKPWLTQFINDADRTSFVIRSWLDSKGDSEEVAPFIPQWLETFKNSPEASYVIKSWVYRTHTIDDNIQEPIYYWIRKFKDHPDADFVIKRACMIHSIPQDILNIAIDRCIKLKFDPETLFTLSHYITRNHMKEEEVAASWLLELISEWIGRNPISENDIANIESILYNTTQNKAFCYWDESIRVSIQWFLSPHSFHPKTLESRYFFMQKWNYFEKYSTLLLQDRIDIMPHRASVEKFFTWVNGWLNGNKRRVINTENINQLKKKFPEYIDLWEMVQISHPEKNPITPNTNYPTVSFEEKENKTAPKL